MSVLVPAPTPLADPEAGRLPKEEEDSPTNTVSEHRSAATAKEPSALPDGPSERDPAFLVGWEEGEPANPFNWSSTKRWYLTFLGGLLTLNASFASSAPSGVIPPMQKSFHFGNEVGSLMIALFLAGYCIGPLLWGPLSETYGRRPIFIISFVGYTAFQLGCALSPNTAAMLVFRFLAGSCAASPLTNSGAVIGDIFPAKTRGKALAIFTLAPFAGPALGPTVSGFIQVTHTDWRWLFWVLTIFAGFCLVLIIVGFPETYGPTLLKHKAQRKRKETGDNRWYAQIEAVKIPWQERATGILAKPWVLLWQEPMLIAITAYLSFVYGCLYLSFESYPIVFQEGHGFNAGVGGLMFLPIFVGGIIAVGLTVWYYNPHYEKLVKEYSPKPVPPEERLPMAVVGAVFFFISLFWFGWTSFPRLSFWGPCLAGGALGLSVILVFLSLFNYMIDTYLRFAASALAANTVVRSIFGAGFPLFAQQMYSKLNPRWASTLLGFIALLLAPIPVLFIRYGPVLRAKSRNAQSRNAL